MSLRTPLFDTYLDDLASHVIGGGVLPTWSPDGKHLAFVEGTAEDRQGWIVEIATGDRRPLVADVAALRDNVRAATGVTPSGTGLPFAAVAYLAPGVVHAVVGTDQLTIELDSATVTKLPGESLRDTMLGFSEASRRTPRTYPKASPLVDPMDLPELTSPDGRWLLSTKDGNLVARDASDGRPVQLTVDGTPEHEYRFDATHPAAAVMGFGFPVCNFSPDSRRIAVTKVDNRGVHKAPQVHYLKREDEVVWRYHGQAGGTLERTTVHVIDMYGQPSVDIQLGDTRDTYPMPVAWTPDGKSLLIVVFSRDVRTARVLLADAASGATRELFSESGETFIRIHHDLYFGRKPGVFLTPDGSQVLWLSERSGYKHLYAYALDGTLLRQLTDGEQPVDYVHRVTDEHVYFTAHLDQSRPYDVHLARVALAGGEVEQLTSEAGVHAALFAPNLEHFIDTYSTPSQPPRSLLRNIGGDAVCELSTATLHDLPWTPPQQFTVTAADGETELWGTMFFPADFDPSKTYPIAEYVYGGPQIAFAPHTFNGITGREPHAVAQLGYVTFVLDARGTPERSKAFHDAVYKNWAGALVADHAGAVQQLIGRHPFLANAKVGVFGGSWGGYTAFRLAAERPDVYDAAFCLSPGYDPYSSVLYECYLGLPQNNPAAYQAASCLELAPQLQVPITIACGTSDHACWTDAMKMTEALIRAGRVHEFIVLPEQLHVSDTTHERYFHNKMLALFDTHLKGA
jgi:dipeptidyl-peptidase-4